MAAEAEQELDIENLLSGDKPSIIALGVYGAESIKKTRMAVFMVDVLGKVHIMPPDSVQVLKKPRLNDETLDALPEEVAINALLAQGDESPAVVKYLRGREGRLNG